MNAQTFETIQTITIHEMKTIQPKMINQETGIRQAARTVKRNRAIQPTVNNQMNEGKYPCLAGE